MLQQFLSGLPLHWMKMTPFVVFIADQSKSEYARFVVRHEAGSSTYQLQVLIFTSNPTTGSFIYTKPNYGFFYLHRT